MNKITDVQEQAAIVHAAKRFYHLYGNVFRELKPEQAQTIAA